MGTFALFVDRQNNGNAINLLTADVRALLLDTTVYTPNEQTDQYLSAIPTGAARNSMAAIVVPGKAILNRKFNWTTITFSGTPTGGRQLLLYLHTGTEATSLLICAVDINNAPVTTVNPQINVGTYGGIILG